MIYRDSFKMHQTNILNKKNPTPRIRSSSLAVFEEDHLPREERQVGRVMAKKRTLRDMVSDSAVCIKKFKMVIRGREHEEYV